MLVGRTKSQAISACISEVSRSYGYCTADNTLGTARMDGSFVLDWFYSSQYVDSWPRSTNIYRRAKENERPRDTIGSSSNTPGFHYLSGLLLDVLVCTHSFHCPQEIH